jgi:hypothetical protein
MFGQEIDTLANKKQLLILQLLLIFHKEFKEITK